MSDTIQSLQRQLGKAEENLRLIQERKADYVQETDIPLQLIRDERRLVARIADLCERLKVCQEQLTQAQTWTAAITAAPTSVGTPTNTRAVTSAVAISVESVWTLPRYYPSDIALLHPSELHAIKQMFNITVTDQVRIQYMPDMPKPDGIIKELIGPFEVSNERNGRRVSVFVTSTTPEYDPDLVRDNSISMSPSLRDRLGLEVGPADIRLFPAEEGLFSGQLEIYDGIPFATDLGAEEEEEEEEEDIVRVVTLSGLLPPELAPVVLAEQSATDLTLVRKISTHEHYWSGGNIELFIQAMDTTGIAKAIFVPTGEGPDNRGYQQNMEELLEIQRRYPDRIIAFATVDEADPNAAQVLEQAIEEGAQGLKLIGGHPSFYDEPLNSKNMYRIIDKCEQFSLPVLIHVSTLEHPEVAAEFEDLLASFPNVTFVAAHYGKFAPELHRMADMLDRFPNLYTDLSMGAGLPRYLAQIHNEPDKFRAFIIQYQDRILWGTDIILSREDTYELLRVRIESDLHLLSREVHVSPFLSSVIPLNGLNLPDLVLHKVLWENPHRILHITSEL